MKRRIFLGGLLLALSLGTAFAQASPEAERWWTLGPEVYYVYYEEPGIMRNEGVMGGAEGTLTPVRRPVLVRLEGRAAAGAVDYDSERTGSDDGIFDWTAEGRAVGGYDLLWRGWTITPYAGAGYRYLNDDSSGHVTTTGHGGYERESHYFYSPIGVDFAAPLRREWSVRLTGEYDVFWSGVQESHLSDAVAALGDLKNDQGSGYGFRFAASFVKKGPSWDLSIEPFIRYWRIEESDHTDLFFSGVLVGYGYEPVNETTEAGLRVAFHF